MMTNYIVEHMENWAWREEADSPQEAAQKAMEMENYTGCRIKAEPRDPDDKGWLYAVYDSDDCLVDHLWVQEDHDASLDD